MRKILAISLVAMVLGTMASAQTDTLGFQKPQLAFDGFLDVFYCYDFNQPDGRRADFFFNHNRHNEFNINLAMARVRVDGGRYRANLALMAGTYPQDNLAAEPSLVKNIFEASAGLQLSRSRDLWLDAGIMPSYIGFESAISTDNLTLTRSLMAENSPYYFSGVKVSYAPDDRWNLALWIVNGWQRIARVEGNSLPGFGAQVTFTPDDRLTINWSAYAGSEYPDEQRRMRIFNDIYAIFKVNEALKLIAAFDIGAEQKQRGGSDYSLWYAPALLGNYRITSNWAIGARLEYYADPDEVIIFTGTSNGFRTFGLSGNLDFQPFVPVLVRLEGRYLTSKDAIFISSDQQTFFNDFAITSSIAVHF